MATDAGAAATIPATAVADGRVVDRYEHRPVGGAPLPHLEGAVVRHRGDGHGEGQVEPLVLAPHLAAQPQHVAEALGGDERHRPTGARSRITLVASVVPCTTRVTSAGDTPEPSSTAAMPAATPSRGSAGVVATLALAAASRPGRRARRR